MNSLQSELFKIITSKKFEEKISLAQNLTDNLCHFKPADFKIFNEIKNPGRPQGFKVVNPRDVPHRKNIHDENQRNHFLHAIANIELLAIELPILCLLRFGCENLEYLKNQIQIIKEEAHHFDLLKNRLDEFNCPFGSLAVHHGLWDYALKCENECEHQILIPCYLEARGLDVCPEFVEKFKSIKDEKTANILQIILDDEIKHVQSGMNYLKQKALQSNQTPTQLFKKTLEKFLNTSLKSRIPINKNYRIKAGFENEMLNLICNG